MSDPESISDPIYKFEHFFELSPDLLCIAGFDGYFRRINPAVSKVLGYTVDELMSRPISDFVYDEDKKITSDSRETVKNSIPLLNFENRYQAKDGKIVWLAWTSMPVVKDQLVYAVAKDITSKKKLEEDRNQLLTDLTKTNQDLKQLSYTTSHDLRSPVNNMISLFSMLDQSKITDEETLEYITTLQTVTQNLSEVLNNSVDNLIRKDKLRIDIELVDLAEVLQSTLFSINSLINNSDGEISGDFSAFSRFNSNRPYLDSIFLNLLTNSIKYARPGIPPKVRVSTEIRNGSKVLRFSDNGMGFDMEKVKDKIFGLNQKFHEHGDSKGIGLYLVYSHVTNLQGSIEVVSALHEGTDFIISFQDPETDQ